MDTQRCAPLSPSDIPLHNIIESQFDPKCSSLKVMCNASQFRIVLVSEDLQGSAFEQEYTLNVEQVDGSDDDELLDGYEEALHNLMLAPCYTRFKDLAPTAPEELTLERFYHPPVHTLRLNVVDGHLISTVVENEGPATIHNTALVILSEELPAYEQVLRTDASDVQILPDSKTNRDRYTEFPVTVHTKDGTKFFKPSFEPSQFTREVNIQLKIAEFDLHSRTRVSKLYSIVISADGVRVLGLLFELILSTAENLYSNAYKRATKWHETWEAQVTSTVKMLHAHDIVWGDVHPGNIVIDTNHDAWVVDFGGGYVEKFVDRKKYDSKDGDWQGVHRVFKEWINRQ